MWQHTAKCPVHMIGTHTQVISIAWLGDATADDIAASVFTCMIICIERWLPAKDVIKHPNRDKSAAND